MLVTMYHDVSGTTNKHLQKGEKDVGDSEEGDRNL